MGAEARLPVECQATAAASNGHLEVLRWAREHNCPWSEQTCRAAQGGQLEMLQWLREHGCPWRESTMVKRPGLTHPLFAPGRGDGRADT